MNQITPWIKLYLPTACAKYAHWLVHMIWRAPQNLNLKKYTSMLFCRCSISCSVILLNSAGFLSLIAEKQLANFSWLQKHRSKIELAWFYKVTGRIMQFWCKLLDFIFLWLSQGLSYRQTFIWSFRSETTADGTRWSVIMTLKRVSF